MSQKTVLNDTHRAAGARMVDFGGWDMPIHYGSQVDEHHQVRRDVGMFDVSHMTVIDLHGARTRDFLRHLLANSIDKLKVPGKALYSCMLNEKGEIVTAHSLNDVPLVHIAKEPVLLKDGGILADIAPTMLDLMGIAIPDEMTGKSLID